MPLAPAAMDWEGCYTDTDKKKGDKEKSEEEKTGEDDNSPHRIPEKLQLHPHDEALIDWKGGLGNTAADTLQARSAARLVQRKQQAHLLSLAPAVKRKGPGPLASSLTSASAGIRLKRTRTTPTRASSTRPFRTL